jgi:D-alanine-D-alanine ligase
MFAKMTGIRAFSHIWIGGVISLLIWAFVPYEVRDGRLEGFDFDTLQSKRELAQAFRELNLAWVWQPIVAANVAEIVKQAGHGESIVLNLCDGIEEHGTPGLCVVQALELAGIPFTGADSEFYRISTSKLIMKEMMMSAGVPTPAFEALTGSVTGVCARVGTPLLVKPDVSAASGGVFLRSKVGCDDDVTALREELLSAPMPRFCDARSLFAERFIDGPEFTAFVMGNWRRPASVRCLPPAERVFNSSIPDGEKFLSYERYWGLYREESPPPDGRAFYAYEACEPRLAPTIEEISKRAYIAVHGMGYARVDLRMDRATGELFVLEVNANCGLSEDDQTSTGCILKIAGMRLSELLKLILRDAL